MSAPYRTPDPPAPPDADPWWWRNARWLCLGYLGVAVAAIVVVGEVRGGWWAYASAGLLVGAPIVLFVGAVLETMEDEP